MIHDFLVHCFLNGPCDVLKDKAGIVLLVFFIIGNVDKSHKKAKATMLVHLSKYFVCDTF